MEKAKRFWIVQRGAEWRVVESELAPDTTANETRRAAALHGHLPTKEEAEALARRLASHNGGTFAS